MPYLTPKINLICISNLLLLFLIGHVSASQHQSSFIQPFSLADVDLDVSSEFSQNEALNHDYLLILDVNNLLYNFRTAAGLPAPGQSYGGWEGSNVEVRGQFIGHYLSALAFAYKSTSNNDDLKQKFQNQADGLLQGLADCQAAHGDGYLSAFPKEHFNRLEALQPVWAPFYVIHKIMQGLLDQHQLAAAAQPTSAAQPKAFDILSSMAKYFCTWSKRVVNDHGIDHWHQVLENEFGGMNDVLYKLSVEEETRRTEKKNLKNGRSSVVSSENWAACAALFDKPAWFDPLVQNQDVLSGLHANTHLAQLNGFASRFEATEDEAAAAAVVNFFNIVTEKHSYSTGGSNVFEHWGEGRALGDAIDNADAAANTQESCTTYNILKIARSLFTWSARPEFADFYERAILNGVLGIQRTSTATLGQHHHHAHHDHSTHFTHAPNLHLPLKESHPEKLTSTERAMISATDAVHAVHPRPAHHNVVSWPDDPATNITSSILFKNNVNNDEPGQPGQFIYYMPLGHEGGKGENPRAWTHGFGDRFNSFWCCYGTAVESFSKLADSIYFWYEHPSPSASPASTSEFESSSYNSSFDSGTGGGTGGTGGDGESTTGSSNTQKENEVYPILFVNQFVSSTLRWKVKEKDVVIKQTADLYSNKVATSRVVITIPTSRNSIRTRTDINSTNEVVSSANFYLYWRLPSWLKNEKEDVNQTSNSTKKEKLVVRINGEILNLSASPRVHGTHAQTVPIEREENQQKEREEEAPRSLAFSSSAPVPSTLPPLQLPLSSSSFHPPTFGKDSSDYIILGPKWNDGDVLEVDMPMKITVEDLNDSGDEKQNLKAIMMGPFQMAGLTESGDREIDIDPEYIENAVTMLETNENYSSSGHSGDSNNGSGVAVQHSHYPRGARLLSGKTKKYVIAPIGQLIDEKYTAYFDFVGPSGAVARQ